MDSRSDHRRVQHGQPATMHYAVDDYGTAERRVRRVTICGGLPVGPTGVESRIVDDPLTAVR